MSSVLSVGDRISGRGAGASTSGGRFDAGWPDPAAGPGGARRAGRLELAGVQDSLVEPSGGRRTPGSGPGGERRNEVVGLNICFRHRLPEGGDRR
jgi:hypothetical protein